MKSMKKALALGLALAMTVTAVPVTSAQAATAPKLNATKATIYVGGNSKLFTVTTPSTWKSVKVTASSSDTSVATVKTASKRVRVSAVKAGTAKVTVKVTGTKSGKKVTKNLAANITVKNPAARIKIDGKSVKKPTFVVGDKIVLTGVSAPKTSPITFKSSDETVATVDADGTLTALKAGTVNIAATNALGAKYVINVTVKEYDFQSVKQTKANELEVVIKGNAKSINSSNVKITNSNNENYPVQKVDPDKNDATKLTITTYRDMKDGKEYKVAIGDAEKTFVATDGVVASVGLEKNTVVVDVDTKINALTMDANGVILDKVPYSLAGSYSGSVTITINVPADGYPTDEGVCLTKVGATATADIVYHSGKYDTNGIETGNVEARNLVITAVDAATVDGWAVKVGESGSSYANVKETRLAAGDNTKSAYIQMTDTAKATSTDISNYTVESSDLDTLYVNQNDENDLKGEVELIPIKAGTAYLVIKDEKTQAVAGTIPVSIVGERKVASVSLTKTSVDLTSGIKKEDGSDYVDEEELTVTVKDQYGEDVPANKADVSSEITKGDCINANVVGRVLTVEAVKEGTATVKLTCSDKTKTLTVNVKAAKTEGTKGQKVYATSNKIDSIIKADSDAARVKIEAFETVGNVKSKLLVPEKVTLKKGGKEIASTTGSSIKVGTVNSLLGVTTTVLSVATDGAISFNVNNPATGWKLETGTYTVEVQIAGVKDPLKQVVTVTDTQPKVTYERVKVSADTIEDCFKFSYGGKEQEVADVRFYTVTGGKDVLLTNAAGMNAVTYAIVTVDLGNNKKLVQKVNIGLTVRVE